MAKQVGHRTAKPDAPSSLPRDDERRRAEKLSSPSPDLASEATAPDGRQSAPPESERDRREKDNLLRAIWDLSPDLLAIKDPRGVYRMANQAFCEWVGLCEKEIAGKTDADLFPGEDGERFMRDDDAVIRTGKALFKEEMRRASQGTMCFQTSRVPYCLEDGETAGLLCSFRNITDLKALVGCTEEAFEAVRKHEQALQQLIDGMPAGVMLLDSDLRLLAWNRVYLSYFDPSVEWRAGARIEDVMPLAEEAGILSRLRRALRTGRPVGVREFRYDGLRKGTTYWHGTAVPVRLRLEDGATAALAMMVVDVTQEVIAREKFSELAALAEQRAAELEAERTRLRTIIESMPIALIVCDRELNVIAANSVTREYHSLLRIDEGLLEKLVLRAPSGMQVLTEAGVPLRKGDFAVTRALQGETCRGQVITCRPQTGPAMTFNLNTAPLKDAGGEVTGVIVAVSDITSQIHAQDQIREIYEREHAVAVKLQISFMLHECPEARGFEITRRYQAALDEALVGGDFYDLFRIPGEKLGIVIADVAGKGLNAAVYTAMTKYMLRAYALEEAAPELVLARLNDALTACTPSEVFVTLVYGILDPDQSTFTFANAGHEQPIHYSQRDRAATSLDVTGRALALMHRSSYTTQAVSLGAGDVLVLYTDGITDAGTGIHRLGKERLLSIVEENPSAAGHDLADAMMRAAVDHAGGKLVDDAALLVIRAMDEE